MTRLLLVTILLLSSAPAYAEWVMVSDNYEEGKTVYVDPDTIRRNGDLVEMLVLFNYKTIQLPTGLAHLSDSTLLQVNCTEKLTRRLEYTWWSGNMRQGDKVFRIEREEENWEPVIPESPAQGLLKVACAEK